VPDLPNVPPWPPDPEKNNVNTTTTKTPLNEFTTVGPSPLDHRLLSHCNDTIETKTPLIPVIPTLKITCHLNYNTEHTIDAMIDSGATSSFIDSEFAIWTGIQIRTGTPVRITLGDGTVRHTNRHVNLDIAVPDNRFPKRYHQHRINAIVVDRTLLKTPLILGMNYLKLANPQINWATGRIHYTTPSTRIRMQPPQKRPLRFPTEPKKLEANYTNDQHDDIDADDDDDDDDYLANRYSPLLESELESPHDDVNRRLEPEFDSEETYATMSTRHNRSKSKMTMNRRKNLISATQVHYRKSSDDFLLSTERQLTRAMKGSQALIFATFVTNDTNDTQVEQLMNMETSNMSKPVEPRHAEEDCIEQEVTQLLKEYTDLFPDKLPPGLPPRRPLDHRIDLIAGSTPPSRPAYRVSNSELDECRKQLDELLAQGHIRPSQSPYGAPVLFVKKKDGTMRMCIDYRALNKITIKNGYPLPRIDELLDRLYKAKYFTKLDFHSGYHQIGMHPDDVEKTAFRTRYGSFEFLVMPFGLQNAPSTFTQIVQETLRPVLDKFAVSYLDDILIYSDTIEDHRDHVRQVLQLLRNAKLYAKRSKCEFFKTKISFLGHTISGDGLQMENSKVKAILDWPTPQTPSALKSFLGLAGYYRRFITHFSHSAAALHELSNKEKPDYRWTPKAQECFDELKLKMSKEPVLSIADDQKPFTIQTDASGFAYGAVLLQEHNGDLRPVAFASHKMLPAETRYPVHEQELLAVVKALQEWRHYVLGRPLTIETDHKSLEFLQTQPTLSSRQARWMETLSQFDFTIKYRKGNTNIVADALSRRADHQDAGPITHVNPWNKLASMVTYTMDHMNCIQVPMDNDKDEEQQFATWNVSSIINQSLLDSIKKAYLNDPVTKPFIDGTNTIASANAVDTLKRSVLPLKKGTDDLLYLHQRIYVPDDEPLKTELLRLHHDTINNGHTGVTKTNEKLSRYFYWPRITTSVRTYVTTCLICQQNKSRNQLQSGLLNPIPTPDIRWDVVTMDLITQLPTSKSGNDAIVVWVDKFSKMVHYVPCRTTITAPELARLFLDTIVRHHGLPSNIISDRDSKFTSDFWKELWKTFDTQLNMSTAYHPEADGQTERANRTLEEMTRAYVNYHQTNWDETLTILEFAYNNSVHSSTGYTPFFLNYGQHPRTPVLSALRINMNSANATAEEMLEQLYESLEVAIKNITDAQTNQAKYANQHRRVVTFQVGDQVMLSTDDIKPKDQRAKKLLAKWIGPFKVIAIVNNVSYRIELPKTMRIHNVFHVSKLKAYRDGNVLFPSRPNPKPRPPPEVNELGEELYEVEALVNRRVTRGIEYYLVLWKGYDEHEKTWIPRPRLMKYAKESVLEYDRLHPRNKTIIGASGIRRQQVSLSRLANSSTLSKTPVPHKEQRVPEINTDISVSPSLSSILKRRDNNANMDNDDINMNLHSTLRRSLRKKNLSWGRIGIRRYHQ